MKTLHIINRTHSDIPPLEVALENELFPKNLAVLLKHYRKHFKKLILANMSTVGILLQMCLRKLLLIEEVGR